MNHLYIIAELTFLYAPLAIGIVIVFRVAKFPDLTADGSFALGGVVSAIAILYGHPLLSIPLSIIAGGIAGFLTAGLYVYLKIDKILAGILVMISMYTINLRLMGTSNIQLINEQTLLSLIINNTQFLSIYIFIVVSLLTAVILYLFSRTGVGLHFRANGQNSNLIRILGRGEKFYTLLGPIIANSLIGLTGGLVVQYQGFADVNMGFGIIIIGLAFLFIGGAIIKSNGVTLIILSAFIGTFIYKSAIYMSQLIGIEASDIKLLTAVLVVISILIARIKKSDYQMEDIL